MNKSILNTFALFKNNNLSISNLLNELIIVNKTNKEEITSLFYYLESDESDEAMIVSLLIWCLFDSPFKSCLDSQNSFYRFLLSINVSSDFYSTNITVLEKEKTMLMIQKGDYLIIVNPTDNNIKCILPTKYQNKTLFCENCNEEIRVSDSLIVPENTFYIISKEDYMSNDM